jgi:hypothetical protein
MLCDCCARAAKGSSVEKAPRLSVAGGRDIGWLARLGVDAANDVEMLALADVRTYSLCAKVHAPEASSTDTPRSFLCGDMVSFLHSGPDVITQFFNDAWRKGVLDNIRLVFVGPGGRAGTLEHRMLQLPRLQMRSHVLYNHLVIRNAIKRYAGVETPATELPGIEVFTKLAEEYEVAMKRCAIYIEDDGVEKAAKPSDGAGVRAAAQDGGGADGVDGGGGEGVDDGIHLESFAVFCESEGAALRQIFEGTIKLFSKDDGAGEEGPVGGELVAGEASEV